MERWILAFNFLAGLVMVRIPLQSREEGVSTHWEDFPGSDHGTGSEQPLEPTCTNENCKSELHGFKSQLFVPRRMYTGNAADDPGLSAAQFQMYAGRPEEASIESMHVALFDDYYVRIHDRM